MNRILLKSGRFLWSWGFMKFILWTVTLIILFYAEEDWRGARAWAAAKSQWQGRGETLNYNRLMLPSVPNVENLATLPLFKLGLDPKYAGHWEPWTLIRNMRQEGANGSPLYLGNWQDGRLPDMERIRKELAARYTQVFKTAPASDDLLEEFQALYPFADDLRAEAARRPYFRFLQPNGPDLPSDRYTGLIVSQISLVQILTLQAILSLEAHQPDSALGDLNTNFTLIAGLQADPSTTAGSCAVGTTVFNLSALYDGLALHSWTDAQLAATENKLAGMDFLAEYELDTRSQAVEIISGLDRLKLDRSAWDAELEPFREAYRESMKSKPRLADFFRYLWPDGWFDERKARLLPVYISSLRGFDLQTRTARPRAMDQLLGEHEDQDPDSDLSLWHLVFERDHTADAGWANDFAYIQVCVDEARVACALERYHLAHGVYAASLDLLVPDEIAEPPHDIMNGQPYHYHLRTDGTFLLHSVGWNQTDDGGHVVYKKENPRIVDFKQGDWVWPTVKSISSSK